MREIESDSLKVTVALHGGSLYSVFDKRNGVELLWQGAPDSWNNRDVVIFPFVARLKDKKYTVCGKEYSMDNHGLARYSDFTVVEHKKDRITLGLASDKNSLARYPFPFEFFVTYVLDDNSLSVSYRVHNVGEKPMFFAVGGHAAYNIDCIRGVDTDDMSGNRVEIKSKGKITRLRLNEDGSLITGETEPFVHEPVLLDKKLFKEYKTLIYGGGFNGARLTGKNGKTIDYGFDAPYLGIWSHENRGGYVCIEPWWGLPDFEECDSELENKRGINRLESGKVFECGYKTVYN